MNEENNKKNEPKNNKPAPAGKKPARKRKIPVAAIVILSIVAAVLIVCAAAFGYVWSKLSLIQKMPDDGTDPFYIPPGSDYLEPDEPDNPDDPDDTYVPDDPEDTAPNQGEITEPPPQDPVDPLDDDDLINIMLVGEDRRKLSENRQRSDTMILLSINPAKKKVSMISFLRDMYVSIPGGYKNNKLNAAYRFGGFKLMKETYLQNFGLTIDGCFAGDFFDFTEIIDMLGGVEITVTEKEAAHMTSFFGVPTTAGTQVLDGAHALAYSRIRKIDSDYNRAVRQRTVMMTLFNKFKHASLGELNDIADNILPKLSTDMSNSEILALMAKILPMIGSLEVNTYSIPYKNGYSHATINGASVEIVDFAVMRDKLENEYLPY